MGGPGTSAIPRMSSLASSNFEVSGTMAIWMSPIVLDITAPTGPESSEAFKKAPGTGWASAKKRTHKKLAIVSNVRSVQHTHPSRRDDSELYIARAPDYIQDANQI